MADNVKEEPLEQVEAPKTTPKKRTMPTKSRPDSTPKKSKPSNEGKKGTPSKIPTCEEELSAADRALIKMKEEGKPWSEIDAQWELMTTVKPAPRSLNMRYSRLKANLARVKDDDVEAFKQLVEKVKNDIEEEKQALEKKLWVKVAAAMEEAGTEKYGPTTLEKEWKKIKSAE